MSRRVLNDSLYEFEQHVSDLTDERADQNDDFVIACKHNLKDVSRVNDIVYDAVQSVQQELAEQRKQLIQQQAAITDIAASIKVLSDAFFKFVANAKDENNVPSTTTSSALSTVATSKEKIESQKFLAEKFYEKEIQTTVFVADSEKLDGKVSCEKVVADDDDTKSEEHSTAKSPSPEIDACQISESLKDLFDANILPQPNMTHDDRFGVIYDTTESECDRTIEKLMKATESLDNVFATQMCGSTISPPRNLLHSYEGFFKTVKCKSLPNLLDSSYQFTDSIVQHSSSGVDTASELIESEKENEINVDVFDYALPPATSGALSPIKDYLDIKVDLPFNFSETSSLNGEIGEETTEVLKSCFKTESTFTIDSIKSSIDNEIIITDETEAEQFYGDGNNYDFSKPFLANLNNDNHIFDSRVTIVDETSEIGEQHDNSDNCSEVSSFLEQSITASTKPCSSVSKPVSSFGSFGTGFKPLAPPRSPTNTILSSVSSSSKGNESTGFSGFNKPICPVKRSLFNCFESDKSLAKTKAARDKTVKSPLKNLYQLPSQPIFVKSSLSCANMLQTTHPFVSQLVNSSNQYVQSPELMLGRLKPPILPSSNVFVTPLAINNNSTVKKDNGNNIPLFIGFAKVFEYDPDKQSFVGNSFKGLLKLCEKPVDNSNDVQFHIIMLHRQKAIPELDHSFDVNITETTIIRKQTCQTCTFETDINDKRKYFVVRFTRPDDGFKFSNQILIAKRFISCQFS